MLKNKILFFLFIAFELRSVDMYFCTASDTKFFIFLTNLIGSIHNTNFDNLKEIAVFDLGLSQNQVLQLNSMQKVKVYQVEKVHPDIIKQFKTTPLGKLVPGWYAWKPVVIKQALEMFPYVLYLDAGFSVLKPLDDLFTHVKQNGYFLVTNGEEYIDGRYNHGVWWQTTQYLKDKFELDKPDKSWILSQDSLMAGFGGYSRKALDNLVSHWYEMAKDLRNFADDGTTPEGFGTARHDQAVLSLLCYTKNISAHKLDQTQNTPIILNVYNIKIPFYLTCFGKYLNKKTHVFHTRYYQNENGFFCKSIRYKNV